MDPDDDLLTDEVSLDNAGMLSDADSEGRPPLPKTRVDNGLGKDASRDDGPGDLRRVLDELGYYQQFTPESQALVSRLLDDLKRARAGETTAGAMTSSVGSSLLNHELEEEIFRLTTENNQLHTDLLREMENHDKENERYRIQLRELEDEVDELRATGGGGGVDGARPTTAGARPPAALEEAERRAQAAEDRAKELAMRLDRALRSMETDSSTDDLRQESMLTSDNDVDDDRIRLLEGEIGDLDAEIDRLKAHNEQLEDQLARTKSQLDHAVAERRLVLDQFGAKPNEGVSDGAAKRISALESQIELLREHMRDLTEELNQADASKKATQVAHDEQVRKLTGQLKDQKQLVTRLQKQLQVKQEEVAAATAAAAKKSFSRPPVNGSKLPKAAIVGAPAPAPTTKRTIVPAARVAPATTSSEEHPSTTELTSTKEKLESAQQELHQQLQEVRELRRTVEGLRADNDRLRSAAYPSSNANSGFAPSQPTQQATTAQLPTVAVVDDEESVRFLRDENRRLRGELEDLQKSLAEMELKANVTANNAESTEAAAGELQQELQRTRAALDDIQVRLGSSEQERTDLVNQLAGVQTANDTLRSELASLEHSMVESQEAVRNLEERIVAIAAERDNILKLYDQLAQELDTEDNSRPSAPLAVPQRDNRVFAAQASINLTDGPAGFDCQGKCLEIDNLMTELQARLELQENAVNLLTTSVTAEVDVLGDALKERLDNLLKELQGLAFGYKQQRETLGKQRCLLVELDREGRTMRENLDGRAVELQRLADVNANLVQQLATLRHQMESAQQSTGAALTQLSRRNGDIHDSHAQIAQLVAEKQTLSIQLKKAAKEAADGAMDVARLAQENQVLTKQITGLVRDRELMQLDIDAAEKQINQLKEAIVMKEDSRNKVLVSYNQLASANDKLQGEVADALTRADRLRHDLDSCQQMLAQTNGSSSAKDDQIRSLIGDVELLKRDKGDLFVQLEALKTQLVHTKSEMSQAATERELSAERLSAKVRDLEVDKMAYESQLASESTKADRFESLLSLERSKREQAEKTIRDLETAVTGLNRKVQSLHAEHVEIVAKLDREISALRTERAANVAKNDSLKAQLSNLETNLADYKDQVRHKQQIIDELLANPGDPHGRSETDKRILAELVATKDQLRSYNSKIAQLSGGNTPVQSNDKYSPLRSRGPMPPSTPLPRSGQGVPGSLVTDSAERRHILKQEQIRLQSDLRGL